MSGSSLDGLDLALCEFQLEDGCWSYAIENARTIPYTEAFRERLRQVMHGKALELAELDRDMGDIIGQACREFLSGKKVDMVASHGHTVFHQPEQGLTLQIGQGARIAAHTGLPTINDFRSLDVALGGQGAPLVPLGERLLFPGHRTFLNLGGICNISVHGPDGVLGYDVCIGNQALDHLARSAGQRYDANGAMARSGQVDPEMLKTLDALPFHQQRPPRSLGREWFNEAVLPLIDNCSMPLNDRLRTTAEHIARQLSFALTSVDGPVLVTGGGAHNGFLIERLRTLTQVAIEVPEHRLVDFKEALLFALLGVLRMRGEVTALASVTGASRNSCGGAVHQPN
ncbi:MAG: anhydro-N-acetylmuramic acid kinase [Flavobacteriales bacterium]|nr:anhydro-N-acetylmuramic acid kinase [Flavobacteriales bacterium]